jgi:DNA polymerase III subunit epsilon
MNKKIDIEQLPAKEIIRNLNFCVFDLETTGGNHKTDKVIEIGLVKIENLEIVDEKDFLIQPEIKIPDFIQKLTGIKQDDVKNAELIENVIDEILEFMGDSILIAHNTSFDIPFFNSVLRRLNRPELENKSLCTNLMTRYLIPNLLNSNLNYMCKIFDIKHKKAHRALDDSRATAELLLNFLKIFIDKDIQKINHLYYPRNRYELDRYHFKDKETEKEKVIEKVQSIKSPALFTLKGENGVILFSIPIIGNEKENAFIKPKIDELPWKTATIRLFGPLLESLIHYDNLFNKMEANIRSETIRFLWDFHLPGSKPVLKSEREWQSQYWDPEIGDFVVANHLVPEQLIIFPLESLNAKSQLIFRYPGHQKKLLQYIYSKSARLGRGKFKKPHFHPLLKEFIGEYLKRKKEEKSDLLLFRKSLPGKKPEEFLKKLDEFLEQNPNSYKYPKEYI